MALIRPKLTGSNIGERHVQGALTTSPARCWLAITKTWLSNFDAALACGEGRLHQRRDLLGAEAKALQHLRRMLSKARWWSGDDAWLAVELDGLSHRLHRPKR